MKYRVLAFLLILLISAAAQTFFPAPTPTPIPAPVITQMTATDRTIQVIWTQAGNALSGDYNKGYFIVSYSTVPGVVTGTVQMNNTMSLSTTIPGLATNTTYYVTVQYLIPYIHAQSPLSNVGSIKTWP